MNIADGHLFSPDLVAASRALTQSGLALLLQTSLVLLPGLWALRVLQQRGSKACGVLGRALLVAVLTSALFSIGLSLRRVPGVWSVTLPDVARQEPRVVLISDGEPTRITAPIDNRGVVAQRQQEAQQSAPSRANDFQAPSFQAEPRIETEPRFFPSTASAIFLGAAFVWLSGAVSLLLWLSACHGALWRLRRRARVVEAGATLDLLNEVCALMRVRAPLLLCHEAAKSPFLTGLLRPAIVLPQEEVWLEAASLRAVLLHEAAHLKRRDLWWSLAGRVGCALLWPQPMLWILCRHLESSSEEACDEAVLRGGCAPHDYARCLLDWAEKMARPSVPERVAGAGVLTGRSSLSQRVTTILDTSRRDTRTPSRRMRVMIVASALLAALATPLLIATHAAPEAETAKPAARQKLQHIKTIGDFSVYIGGVSRGVLQKVGIIERRQGRIQMLLQAHTARRDAASNRWIFSDGVLYTFSDAKGFESRSTFERLTYAPQTTPSVTAFLEEQSRALDEPLSAAELASKKYPFTIPIAEFDAVKAWAKGRGRATITGRVLDADGKPVAGARVVLTMTSEAVQRITKSQPNRPSISANLFAYSFVLPKSTRDLLLRQVVTSSDGTYRATGLAGVAYKLSISTEYGRMTQFKQDIAPPAQVMTARQRVEARENQSVTAPDLTLTRGGLLQVRVENTSGVGLPEVHVICSVKRSDGSTYLVETDASGQSLFRLPLGLNSVAIGSQGGVGATSNGVTYSIGRNAKITLDGGTPRAFSGATNIEIVPDKTRQVVIRLQPYVAPTPPPPTPTPQRRPPPPGTASISGRVVDEANRPVGGIPIMAVIQQKARWTLMKNVGLDYSNDNTPHWSEKWDSIQGVLGTHAITRADGSFILRGLTTAPYNLIVAHGSFGSFGLQSPDGYVAQAVEGTWAREGQSVRRAQPIVLMRGAIVRGRIVDKATGKPLGGVTFGFNGPQLPASSDNVMGASSDAQGRFMLRLAPGTTSLYIAGPSHQASEEDFVYADTGKPDNAYHIDTNRGLYAGSNGVQFEIDDGKPQFTKNQDRIPIQASAGQTLDLTLRLRRLMLRPASRD